MSPTPSAKIAVFSDIHGNLEAFRAVLADMDAQGAGRLLNLGDIVGYGPEPEACVHLVRERGVESVMGNHELGLVEAKARGWFNPQARRALDRTRQLLTEETIAYLETLPRSLEAEGALFVHGCPPRLVSKYLYELTPEDLLETFRQYENRLCFAGHTHELELISLEGGCVRRRELKRGPVELGESARHIVNAGSIGQPRDGTNKAKWLLWEPASGRVEVRCVPYDIAKTAARIIEVGLPSVYADRLW